MSRRLYSLLLYCLLPGALLWTLWRGWRHRDYRDNLRHRLSVALPARADRPLWFHAASVGEVRALVPLLGLFSAADLPLLVTVGTPTGLARARALWGHLPAVSLRAAPWDLPGAARRFMAAQRPRAGVFVESELWPNLVAAARDADVPLVLVSARLSARSLQRYLRWLPRLMHATVAAFSAIGAQSEADRERFTQLGGVAVSVTGNLKFDLAIPDAVVARGDELRRHWAGQRALWVAGSTHAGEEEQCLAAHALLLAATSHQPQPPLLAIAPRRPERFDQVARLLAGRHPGFARSSTPGSQPGAVDVVLIDEMGVLPAWYAAADAVFVGGSLVPVGGHNLLEPALLGRPVLSGPHQFNAPEVAATLRNAGALHEVDGAAALAAALATWLEDPAVARAVGAKAAAVTVANRGAAARASALVAALMERDQTRD